MKKRAVFFDRDGTLIVDKVYLNDVNQIEYLPEVFEALRRLRDQGFLLLVATNQSGIARGIVSIENLYRIHEQLRMDFAREGVDIAGFYFAPFSVESNHHTRKPNPGMLLQGAKDFGVSLEDSFMIGDRTTDVEAGHRAGAKTILLAPSPSVDVTDCSRPPHNISSNLMEAVDFILSV